MLVRFFRKSYWYTPFTLLLLGGLLWLDAFLQPERALQGLTEQQAPLFDLLVPLLLRQPLASLLFAFLLLMVQVVLINYIASNNQLTDRFSGLAGLVYLLIMSSTPALSAPHPALFANLFVLLALARVLPAYEEGLVVKEVFNAGLLVATAGLFYWPANGLILFLVLAMLIYYIVSIRSLLALLLGFAFPPFALAVYYFVKDATLFPWMTEALWEWHPLSPDPGTYELSMLIVLTLLGLLSMFRLASFYMPDKPIRIRKRIQAILLLFFVSLATYLLATNKLTTHHAFLAPALSVSMALFFYGMGRSRWAEILFTLFLVSVLLSRLAVLW